MVKGRPASSRTAVMLRHVIMALSALKDSHSDDPIERMRVVAVAVAHTETLLAHLREQRDTQIVVLAQDTRHGYGRIGRAAGMSASRAARIAKHRGVPPRHVRDDDLTPE